MRTTAALTGYSYDLLVKPGAGVEPALPVAWLLYQASALHMAACSALVGLLMLLLMCTVEFSCAESFMSCDDSSIC